MTGENTARLSAVAYAQHQPPRKPPSPQVQQQPSPVTQLSPSTVKESPQQTPRPFDASSSAEPTSKKGMVRSQIACVRCRKSKTKCENTGQGTVCKACANTGRECQWEHGAFANSTGSLRRDSTADDVQPKKRRKTQPLAPTSSANHRLAGGLGTYEDALESPLLTAQVWEELFAIYEKHHSIDFPFLHKRTFLSAIQQPSSLSCSDVKLSTQSQGPRPYAPLLLAFLTQTARFHDKLVQHMGNDPIKTANFYAQATRTQMGAEGMGEPTVEKIQALLMLGYYEWTALQSLQGWVKIGTAIRSAIALGYTHLDVDKKGQAVTLEPGKSRLSEKDQFIRNETERRTFWSCCLIDSYLSWGENRPSMLTEKHYQRTQLPCSDDAFNYGRKTRTRLWSEDDTAYTKRREDWDRCHNETNEVTRASDAGKWEIGESEAPLTWYIKVVILFGEVVEWSCNGGRRREGKVPPFHPPEVSRFRELEDKLKRLKQALPDHLRLTADNTADRVYNKPGPEYLPSLPWKLRCPQGPLEEPLIDEDPPTPDYWIQQAKDMTGACRDFTDLLHSLESAGVHSNVVETPMVAFACFSVDLCTIYCFYFPNMDPDSSLSLKREPRAHDIANGYLVRILVRYAMARSWLLTLAKWQRYYRKKRNEYKELGGNVGDSPQSSTSDGGGGLKDYAEQFETAHKQFGEMTIMETSNWASKDKDLADSRLPRHEDSAERTLPPVSAIIKHETEAVSDVRSDRPSLGAFTSVNRPAMPNGTRTPSNSHMPVYEAQVNNPSYQQLSTPQYPIHASPPNVPFPYSTPSLPQTTMSNPGHHSTAISGQSSGQYQDFHAARSAFEMRGCDTHDNISTFDPIMVNDPNQFPNMQGWILGQSLPFYDNSNNPTYYTPASGVGYPYQQQ